MLYGLSFHAAQVKEAGGRVITHTSRICRLTMPHFTSGWPSAQLPAHSHRPGMAEKVTAATHAQVVRSPHSSQ